MIYITETPKDSKTGSAKYFGKKEVKGLVLKLRGPPESVHKAACYQDFMPSPQTNHWPCSIL